ncbi:hypothetical protein AB9Q52_013340 [Pantoea vagans]|uniref:hypothetical protein n=1 Tax=Pantoea vagans TaxID=470934 RepID=UPI0035195B8C
MKILNELLELAKKATSGKWIADSGEGWDAIISQQDMVNGNFIVGEFIGPDSKANKDFVLAASPENILAIAEAFRALEQEVQKNLEGALAWQQRAEAAEAKQADLEKQDESRWNTHDGIARPIGLDKDDLVYLRMKRQEIKLPYPAGMVNWEHDGGEFDVIAWASVNATIHPAPAVSLAELVPPEMTLQEAINFIEDEGALSEAEAAMLANNACRAAILRNIEEAG